MSLLEDLPLVGEPVNYVELDPDPAKTKYLLRRLQAFGIDIHSQGISDAGYW